jgi:hypothetical protein
MKIKLLTICGAVALLGVATQAGTVSFSTTAPTPGASDLYNLTAGANDSDNVSAGADAATYVAMDRDAAQGQTFTTGSFAGGYVLNGFWLQHVLYQTSQGNGTWWNVNTAGAQLTFRLIDPTADSILNSASYTITGTEPNNFGGNDGNANQVGTGTWMYFTFDSPITLNANTTYGLDLQTAASPNFYFEMAGDNLDVYSGGSAYSTTRAGATPTINTGDHVFDVSLTETPEPSALALIGLGGLVVLLRRRSA